MEIKKFEDIGVYLKGMEIEAIGNKAINDVKLFNKKKGIPLVYSIDHKIYYELADGTITTNSPFKIDKNKSIKYDELSYLDKVNILSRLKLKYLDGSDKFQNMFDNLKLGYVCNCCLQMYFSCECV